MSIPKAPLLPTMYDEYLVSGGPVTIRKDTSQVTATEILVKQREAELALKAAQQSGIDPHYLRDLLDSLHAHPPTPPKLNMNDARDRTMMLCMRLRCTPKEFPFQHYTTIYANEKVFVTVIVKGEAVMFTDDASLFPSDQLVSSLTLLQE